MFAFLQKRLLIFYQLKTNDDIDVCYTGLRRPRRILLIAKSFRDCELSSCLTSSKHSTSIFPGS